MMNYNDLMVSARDAETLAVLVGDRRRADALEVEAANALERLPGDRVAMGSLVAYRQEPGGVRRTVSLVHPSNANAAEGRVSVLSPVGRALLGRKRGAVTSIDVPGGRALTLRVLEVGNDNLKEAA